MFKIVFLFSLLGKLALGAESNLLMKFNNLEVINNENPIMGKWSAVVNPGEKENSINLNVEFKDTVPQDALLIFEIVKDDGSTQNLNMRLCDAMHEVIVGHDLFSRLSPKDKAPKKCPIQPASLVIENYSPNKSLIPPGLAKDGILKLNAKFTDANKNPWVIVKIDLEMSHDSLIPKIG